MRSSPLFPVQRGMHWPSCADRSCEGCLPELIADALTPSVQCAPALGVHVNCEHGEGR